MEKCNNTRLASNLMGFYTSSLGAVSDYIYNNILLDGSSESMPNAEYVSDGAKLFERFALEKMQDFQAIGSLIFSLGLTPVINTSVRTPYYNLSGDLPSRTPVVLHRMLSAALRTESEFANSLSVLINKSPSAPSSALELLNGILANSQCRINRLQNLLN